MSLSRADQVWNRAAAHSGGPRPRPGDEALAGLLLAHGMVMNGGVFHCLEVLTAEELRRALDGYRYFGFTAVADLLLEAKVIEDPLDVSDAGWIRFDERYGELVPEDQLLADRFEERFEEDP